MAIGIELLREFVVLAEERSFGRAARRLYISQPTLSKHLRRLETQVQAPLIVRTNPLLLTSAGAEFLGSCRDIIERYDSTLATIRQLRDQPTLRLVGPFQCRFLRDAVLAAARVARNKWSANVSLVEVPLATAFDLVCSDEADLAFSCGPAPEGSGLCAREIARPKLAVAVPAGHPLADQDDVTVTDLGEMPLVTPGGRYENWRASFLQLCATRGLAPRTITRHSDWFDLHLDELSDQTIVTCEHATTFLSFPGFEVRPVGDPDATATLRVYWSATAAELTRSFVDLLPSPPAPDSA